MTNRLQERLAIPGRSDLWLRKTRRDDSYTLAPLIARNREFLRPQWWTHAVGTPADAQPFVDDNIMKMEAGTHMQYRIMEGGAQEFPRMVGTVTMHSYSAEERRAYLGYWVIEDVAGRGYASASSRRLISYAKEVWDLEQIKMNIAPDNENSQNLATALGASWTGETAYETWLDDSQHEVQVWSVKAA